MGLIPTRGSTYFGLEMEAQKKKKKIDILVCKTMREVISTVNSSGLTKDDIIQVVKGDLEWYVLYQK